MEVYIYYTVILVCQLLGTPSPLPLLLIVALDMDSMHRVDHALGCFNHAEK